MNRPLLFLDIDGVLNDRSCFMNRISERDSPIFGFKQIEVFDQMIRMFPKEDRPDIAVISGWAEDGRYAVSNLCQLLGFDPSTFTVYYAGILSGNREEAIDEQLRIRGKDTRFAILDDDVSFYEKYRSNLVLTGYESGLTPMIAGEVFELLSNNSVE